jgi:hypothetical protein
VTTIGFTASRIVIGETSNNAVVTLNVAGADLEQEKVVVSISTHDITAEGIHSIIMFVKLYSMFLCRGARLQSYF